MARKTKKRRGADSPPLDEFPNLVGWRGVSVRVPADWSPVTVSQEGEHGYLKVISPDTRVLELKWEQRKGVVSVPDALERYRRQLEKSARKSRQELIWRERPRGMGPERPRSQAPLTYAWEADRAACGVIWHCGENNRLVIAELVGELDDDLSLAPAIFRSVREHRADGWLDWGIDGLHLQAPEKYRLQKHLRMSGNLRLQFQRSGQELVVERWGLAEIVLREASALEWFTARQEKLLARLRYDAAAVEVNGHPAWRLEGRERLPAAAARVLRSLARLTWPALWFRCWLWSCPQTNRIFAISGMERKRDTAVDEIVERLECHAAAAGGR